MIEKFKIEKTECNATLIVCNNPISFILKAGSVLNPIFSDSMPNGWQNYIGALKDNGIIVEIENKLYLMRDEYFVNPSEPAAIALGRNANGYSEWRNENGHNIREVFDLKGKETL